MITELTPEQWTQVHAKRDQWLAHGLSTAPADRPTAETAITEMYRLIGKAAPQFLWVDSPATANLAMWLFGGKLDKASSLYSSLRSSLDSSLDSSLYSSLDSDQLRLNYSYLWGQTEAYWIAFYQVPEQLGIVTYTPEDSRRLNLWADIARSCGWWWPYDGLCIISERPSQVHTEPWANGRDGAVRLHSETGPALAFRDGWAVHSWHGTRVPAGLVEGDGWTTAQILAEENQEIRRCAIERIGWDRFVDRAQLARVGDAVPDPGNPGNTIALYDIPEQLYDEPVRVLLATNGSIERDGTRRRFGLTVPADISDPVEAAAWTYGWTAGQYRQLEVRR